ncbi:MAG: hypothetical protein E6R03_16930 [Hyphomicrobiaceae bacterium]|nr:MAG: hypothetical protein E6R03_16930 [Hyphomicrobiaceae bacterium]
MDEQLISIGEWAKERGISKQWAITLAQTGRLPGARIVNNWRWELPANTPSPTRKLSDRMARAAARRAEWENAQADRVMRKFGIIDDDEL